MFIVQVAADIFHNKTNFELSFSARPSFPELVRAVETAFSTEISIHRPDSVPSHTFHLSKFKNYDDHRNKWVDCTSEAQLQDLCQLYAFQTDNPWHKESQKEIPPAVRPPASSSVRNLSTNNVRTTTYTTTTNGNSHNSLSRAPDSAYRPTTSSTNIARAHSDLVVARTAFHNGASDVSDDEKVRTVFNEFDLKNQRSIESDDLKQGFHALGMDFSTATLNDLFQKGDLNGDGRISYPEFEQFSRLYPIMIDCLYYRSKAFWDDQNTQREIDTEKESVRQAQALIMQAEQSHRSATKAVEDANRSIVDAENELKETNIRRRDLTGQSEQLNREKERAQREKYDRENEAISARDRERAQRELHTEIQKENEKLDRRLGGLTSEHQRADERVRQLEQQLLEAKRVSQRALEAVKQGQFELEAGVAKERDAAKNAETHSREISRFDDAHKQSEANFTCTLERIRELENISRDLNLESEDLLRRRDAAERAAVQARDQEAHNSEEVVRAKQHAEEREAAARVREQELVEQQKQRQFIATKERALIEQELRLVEQRESLNEKEGKLKTEATSFLSEMRASVGVSLTGRGASSHTYTTTNVRSDSRPTTL